MASSTARIRSSKAQAALAKIIAIISTVRPPPDLDLGAGGSQAAAAQDEDAKPVSRVDLGLRLGLALSPEIRGGGRSGKEDGGGGGGPTQGSGVVDAPTPGEDSGDASTVEKASASFSQVESSAGASPVDARSSEGECDPEEEESHKGLADGLKESSEITNKPTEFIEEEDIKGAELAGLKSGESGEGYLDLLLEAVRQVSGGFSDNEPVLEKEKVNAFPPPPETAEETRAARPKRKEAAEVSWVPFDLYEDTAPIVRSKRGRSQALPSRYRDSVLEPWRKPPTVARHRRAARPR